MLTINTYRSALALVFILTSLSVFAQDSSRVDERLALIDTAIVAEQLENEAMTENEYAAQTLWMQTEIRAYLEQNLMYTDACKAQRAHGRVMLALVINDSGQLEDLAVIKGLSAEVDELALMIMKNWSPAARPYRGATNIVVPIEFKFE